MCLERLLLSIRLRLNPPKEVDRVWIPKGPFKPVAASIEYGLRESGHLYETFHFETWDEGFTPEQIPDIVRLCMELATRYCFDDEQPELVRDFLQWFLADTHLPVPTLEEMEEEWDA